MKVNSNCFQGICHQHGAVLIDANLCQGCLGNAIIRSRVANPNAICTISIIAMRDIGFHHTIRSKAVLFIFDGLDFSSYCASIFIEVVALAIIFDPAGLSFSLFVQDISLAVFSDQSGFELSLFVLVVGR